MSRRDKRKAPGQPGASPASTIGTLTEGIEGSEPTPASAPAAEHEPTPEIGPPVDRKALPRPPETAGAPDSEAAPKDDGKITCPDCNGRFLFSEMVPFIDGEDGGQRGRCKPCAEKLQPAVEEKRYVQVKPVEEQAPAPVAPSEDAAAQAEALARLLETPEQKELRAENERLRERLESLEKAAGSGVTDSRLTRDLLELSEQKLHLERRLLTAHEALEESHTRIRQLTTRLRDLEVLLAFDNPVNDNSLPGSPEWMLKIAADVASDAPTELDERSLMLLLVDTLSKGYMHRTAAAGIALKELTETEEGAALFALSEAALGVIATLRTVPDEPPEMRKNAITDAWLETNRAASRATAMVRAEVDRLLALEAQEVAARRPQVPAAGQGRRFSVARPVEAPAAPEPEDEDDEDDL